MMRYVLPVLVVSVLGAGVMWIQSQFASSDEADKVQYRDGADRELQDSLRELSGAWNPRKKRRVLARVKTRASTIQAPLLRLLGLPRHPKLGSAMFLAAELGLQDARPLLVDLMRKAPRELRAEAALAASKIRAWSADELAGLLASDDVGLRVAGLMCWKQEPHISLFETVLGILEGRDLELANAALDALPEKLPAAQKLLLRERLAEQSGEARITLLRALGRVGIGAQEEELLVQALWDESSAVRRAAIQALTRKPAPLNEPRAVLELIQNDGDQVEVASALYCLERTSSFRAIDIRNRVSMIEGPLARYFAARCLVSRGNERALAMLVPLVTADAAALPGTCSAEALRTQARTLLSRLSGLKTSSTPAQWSAWAESGPGFSARALDALELAQLRALGLRD